MNINSTPSITPPWLATLADDAILSSSALNDPVQGKKSIIKIVQTVGNLYESQRTVFHTGAEDRDIVAYEAKAFDGMTIHGLVILSKNAVGEVNNVEIYQRPLAAAKKLSATLRDLIGSEIGAEHFDTKA